MNRPDQPDFQAAYNTALVSFRNQDYRDARKRFLAILAYPGLTQVDELRARRNLADCIFSLLEDTEYDTSLLDEFESNLWRYLAILAQVPPREIAPIPIIGLFEQTLRFRAFCPLDDQLTGRVANDLGRFEQAAKGKIQPTLFVDSGIKVVEELRRKVGHPQHVAYAERIAAGVLESVPDGSLSAQRAMLNNLLADLAYFFPRSGEDDQQRYARVLVHLDRSLELQPRDNYAGGMKVHVQRLATTNLQIKRFGHDTRNRMGNIRQLLKQLLAELEENPPAHHLAENLRREFENLLLVHRLVEGQQPAPEEWQLIDPHEVVQQQLAALEWPTECIRSSGERSAWEFCPNLVGLALGNLLRNSREAYQRRKLPFPDPPVNIQIDYRTRKIFVRDHAGGIDEHLGDVFAPYVSSKSVRGNVGLGLTQARDALRMQSPRFRLYLPDPQPADGAEFVVEIPPLD